MEVVDVLCGVLSERGKLLGYITGRATGLRVRTENLEEGRRHRLLCFCRVLKQCRESDTDRV